MNVKAGRGWDPGQSRSLFQVGFSLSIGCLSGAEIFTRVR
ncbi:hypothetical protein RISK_001486 [Rhodopirellula islandica]|uniref:Uncharacterized protein n=1 Tax=Rhodopirellula islandica TaxID=595434 RepID=A0A0J1BIA4_RHOIS|nr:hypothetical protein RISK_001486 [Rhodopirellula islandica]